MASELVGVTSRATSAAKVVMSRRRGRRYSCDTVLERLAQGLEHMAPKLGQLIQEEDAVVRQRHVARHGHVAPTDQPHRREGMGS